MVTRHENVQEIKVENVKKKVLKLGILILV